MAQVVTRAGIVVGALTSTQQHTNAAFLAFAKWKKPCAMVGNVAHQRDIFTTFYFFFTFYNSIDFFFFSTLPTTSPTDARAWRLSKLCASSGGEKRSAAPVGSRFLTSERKAWSAARPHLLQRTIFAPRLSKPSVV
jgi:hypothetical protein